MSTVELNISTTGMSKATFKKIKKRWIPGHTVEINYKTDNGKLTQFILVIKDCYNRHLLRRMVLNWRSSKNEWEAMGETQIKPFYFTIDKVSDPQEIPEVLDEIYREMLESENSIGSEHGL